LLIRSRFNALSIAQTIANEYLSYSSLMHSQNNKIDQIGENRESTGSIQTTTNVL
jgi:hypothetical protein